MCFWFLYRERRIKHFNSSSLSWNKTKLTYTQQKTFHFSSETSGKSLKEDDIICTVNLAMVVGVGVATCSDNTAFAL